MSRDSMENMVDVVEGSSSKALRRDIFFSYACPEDEAFTVWSGARPSVVRFKV